MDAGDWDRRYEEKPWLWRTEPNVFLVSEVGDMIPGRALDVACGEGRNAVWLAERGWRVDAVDFSSVAIERARALAAERGVEVNFEVADVTSWEPSPLTYDLVIVLYLHLPPEQRRQAIGRARDAGVAVVVASRSWAAVDRAGDLDGFIGAGDLSAPKARLALMAALATTDSAGVGRWFSGFAAPTAP